MRDSGGTVGQSSGRGKITYAAQALALFIAYVGLGLTGLGLAPVGQFATLVWPPAGIALAALVLGGHRLWPAVALAALTTNLVHGAPLAVALGIAAGNTGEAVVGSYALGRLPGFSPSLERFRDVVALAALAGMGSTVVSATVGVASLGLAGIVHPASLWHSWRVWWTGDLLGILLVAPVVMTWVAGPRVRRRRAVLARAAASGAFLAASAAFLFLQRPETLARNPILEPYMLVVPLMFMALRFGVRGAASGVFLVAVAGVFGTYTGHGAFVRDSPTESLFALHVFLIAASLSSLLLGSIACELRDKAAVLRGIIDGTPDAIYVKDRRGRYVVTNTACARLLGFHADEPPGAVDAMALPADEARRLQMQDQEILQMGQSRAFDECVTIAGLQRVYHTSEAPYRDCGGDVVGVIGISRDITDRRHADQARAELLVREQAARAEAEAATRAKDQFLAVLSHELRTPLQSVLGWTQMLRSPDLDPRTVAKGREAIERNLKMQLKLIEDLLDISRIVAGKLHLARQRVDLGDVVESAVSSATATFEAKALLVEVSIEKLDREVLGDPVRLHQIVSNLLSNAVKFTPRGGRIGVRLERDGEEAKIVVEDSGCGISAEFLPRVFDRFGQEDSTSSRSYGGLGLGLTIVRHLVELQGGRVRVSSPGRGMGTRFVATLPLVRRESAAVGAAHPRDRGRASIDTVSLAGIRVLVVDDDPDACELLETILRAWGGEVFAVRSARAALSALRSQHFDVLMSDIGMPEEDGYALVGQVRAREVVEGGHIPAVALSAFASEADREQALALGFEAHLAKPASPADLVNTVARLGGRVS